MAGEQVDVAGEQVSAAGGIGLASIPQPVPVLIAALGPRLLRLAATKAQGTILWMANAASIRDHVAPLMRAASDEPGRIVAGLPVCVTDDVDGAREIAGEVFHAYGTLVNYQRILAAGGIASPADAAVIGDEASVAAQLGELIDAGATDIWAAAFPGDREGGRASVARTRSLLRELASTD